eukprot:scaffold201_cov48-Cyclotella_meneghiniana.AAC.5
MSCAPRDRDAGRKTRVLMSVASRQKACLQESDNICPVLGTCRDMSQDIYNLAANLVGCCVPLLSAAATTVHDNCCIF